MNEYIYQSQGQNQNQYQEQMKLRSLNGWLNAMSELDVFEILPFNFEYAKFCKGELLSSLDNCITQTLAPVKQINEKGTSNSLKKRYIIRILEWLSLRNKQFDVIDELSIIVILNCLGKKVDVPYRIQVWNGVITQDQLKEFALSIGQSQLELEKWVTSLKNGKKTDIDSAEKPKNGNVEIGLQRFKINNPLLYTELKTYLGVK
jgi:hypothetical protein